MIGKTVKGNGFGGVLRYVFEKPEAQYIGGNMANSTPRALAREFGRAPLTTAEFNDPSRTLASAPARMKNYRTLKHWTLLWPTWIKSGLPIVSG
jgi:hypothetical protein